MVSRNFTFTGTPEIIFETGSFARLPDLIADRGQQALIVTGGSSLRESGHFHRLMESLENLGVSTYDIRVAEEPSPDLIDRIVDEYLDRNLDPNMDRKPDVIAAIGGGSVMDTGKAISAMLPTGESVMKYLEGAGEGQQHPGDKVPFIAVPTTSGTGSEATKNAVLSRVGPDGFKKSLRHDNFIPDLALLDPELTVSCPSSITAASGLDALTQLMGAYLSTEASPLTDSLVLPALRKAGQALVPVATDEPDNLKLRADMAYASMISGIVLANAGLGIVHGLAGPIGGFFEIPHGVACGTLFAEAVRLNIELLQQRKEGQQYLEKYAQIGAYWNDQPEIYYQQHDLEQGCQLLIETIEGWLDKLDIPRLGQYGVTDKDLDKIAEAGGNKNNPVKLDKSQMKMLLGRRI